MSQTHPSTRRQFLQRAATVGGAAAFAAWANPIIERAHAADPNGQGSLADIEHIVLLMQENRSFDHYYGTLSGVRGFDDPSPFWQQYGWTPGFGLTPTGYPSSRSDWTRCSARACPGSASTTRHTTGGYARHVEWRRDGSLAAGEPSPMRGR